MSVNRIPYIGWIFVLAAVLVATPAFAADESNMTEKAAAWEKNYNDGNLKAIQAMYAADGCRMPPHAPASMGSDAILAQLQSSKEAGPKVKIAVKVSETSGTQGYATGTYEITGADGSHIDHGKWMNVSKKVDGAWKIQCDIWNSDMALPAAEGKK